MPVRSISSITLPLERRRSQVEQQRSTNGRVHRVSGFITLTGSGEALVDVGFPVWFVERPAMSFGGELGDNEVLETGNFPTINVMVKDWKTDVKAGACYYIGATLIVVTTGTANQRTGAHWQMEGNALVSPLTIQGSTDDAI